MPRTVDVPVITELIMSTSQQEKLSFTGCCISRDLNALSVGVSAPAEAS